MSTDHDAHTARTFRTQALSLQRTFSALTPLIQRTYLLSANAEITSAHLGSTGASFSIIARELVYVVREVSKLIEELDQLFRTVARSSADWLRAERQAGSLRESIARMARTSTNAPAPLAETLSQPPGQPLLAPPEAHQAAQLQHSAGQRMSAALEVRQIQVLQELHSVVRQMKRTTRYVNRLSWVAVRQCHFVAVTARIEAARANGAGKDIAAVAEEIRHLADDIATAEQVARHGVFNVIGMVKTLTNGQETGGTTLDRGAA